MATESQRKKMARLKQQKKLGVQPKFQVSSKTRHLAVTVKERDRYTQQFSVILLSIEKAIVEFYQNHPELNDSLAALALESFILKSEPHEPLARQLYGQLQSKLIAEEETPNDVLQTGLKIILDSIATRSSFGAKERSYLDYAVVFVSRSIR